MKKLSIIILLFSTSLFVHAQNKEIEAIAAYQMAEESFDAKNYEAALKHINTTKTILGTANSKILHLEVQILEELSQANPEYLKDLQSAIHAFEQASDIDQFSQDKRVEVAKIKIDLGKRKAAFEKEENRKLGIQKQYKEMIYRLASELPKTEVSVSDFMASIPTAWGEMTILYIGGQTVSGKITEKRINKIVERGSASFYGYNYKMTANQFTLNSVETYKRVDKVSKYRTNQLLKKELKKKERIKRIVTVEELCRLLKIPEQMWKDFTSGNEPLIKLSENGNYFITYGETEADGKQKTFKMTIYKTTEIGYFVDYYECLYFDIFENTF